MWIDERGSEVLTLPECRALLALGYEQHRYGHLAIPTGGAPIILPMDYGLAGPDVVIATGASVFEQAVGRLVAFQADGLSGPLGGEGGQGDRLWSVLVRGLASLVPETQPGLRLPVPHVPHPGDFLLRIRADVLTGRRLGVRPAAHAG